MKGSNAVSIFIRGKVVESGKSKSYWTQELQERRKKENDRARTKGKYGCLERMRKLGEGTARRESIGN